jgi:hypothetical protein
LYSCFVYECFRSSAKDNTNIVAKDEEGVTEGVSARICDSIHGITREQAQVTIARKQAQVNIARKQAQVTIAKAPKAMHGVDMTHLESDIPDRKGVTIGSSDQKGAQPDESHIAQFRRNSLSIRPPSCWGEGEGEANTAEQGNRRRRGELFSC